MKKIIITGAMLLAAGCFLITGCGGDAPKQTKNAPTRMGYPGIIAITENRIKINEMEEADNFISLRIKFFMEHLLFKINHDLL